MISYAELFALAVYAAMAGYIMYLQHKRKQADEHIHRITMLLHGVALGELKLEVHKDGFSISRKREDTGEVQAHQRGTP